MRNVPPPAKNWSDKAKKKCIAAGNAVLRSGGSEQDAIYACIHNAGKTKHPHGKSQPGERYRADNNLTVKNTDCCADCAEKAAKQEFHMNLKTLAQALKIVKGADPAAIAAITDDAALEKAAGALESLAASRMPAHEIVDDHWTEGNLHRAPTAEEINVGPSESASGAGAEKMVRDYSKPAPQSGVQLDAEKLARVLPKMMHTMKAHDESIATLVKTAQATNTLLKTLFAKAEEDEEDEEDEEEESEVVEINASRAKALFKKAQKLLTKAEEKKEEMEDMDKDERKACKAEIKALRKAAAKLIVKARTAALAGRKGGADTLKSIRELLAVNSLLKSDINVVQEEEEEEEEEEEDEDEEAKARAAADLKKAEDEKKKEEEEKKALEVAEKAKTHDKGNQADHKDAATGNQADEAAKAVAEIAGRVEKALTGLAVLQTDVRGLFDVIAGKSRVGGDMPEISKASTPDKESALLTTINEMEDKGSLDMPNAMAAREILTHMGLARAGQMDPTIVNDRLARAPAVIRDIFKQAA
ncbi:MAG: hypothetical protein KGJ90_00390 [Patescibacteria group bacterium]|nr:hypothetical protein [Patescibacteria group bacterium]